MKQLLRCKCGRLYIERPLGDMECPDPNKIETEPMCSECRNKLLDEYTQTVGEHMSDG